jgi:protein tyrosine phosphatase
VIREEIPGQLYASARPGYDFGRNQPVARASVEHWIGSATEIGVRSVLCLLNAQHLCLYDDPVHGGLLDAYRNAGFTVAHLPVQDHVSPPLTPEELKRVAEHFEILPKPVVIHCSAGVDRTGAAVRHLKQLHQPDA